MKSVIVIGAGFAGLSAASFMAKAGWKVTVIEKNSTAGGRAQQLKANGFTFDMGPSWYWMPEVFERYFNLFGKSTTDYYDLKRLDPSYRVYWKNNSIDVPANFEELKDLFESLEKGSSKKLEKYLSEAEIKYNVGIKNLVYKPGQSILEYLDWDIIKNVFKLQVFSSIKSHIAKHFKNNQLRQLMEFPVLFLGALPQNTPALYSLMNYADVMGGTWYPNGGIYSVINAMKSLAEELGVEFKYNEAVKEIEIEKSSAKNVISNKGIYEVDSIISGADYHFTETIMLPEEYRSYSEKYWDTKVLAPSCLLFYIGLNKKLKNVLHHSLFFDVPFDKHANEIYKDPQWPVEPLFYLNVPSVTDPACAPEGCENLMVLIPIASGLANDAEEVREKYFQIILSRIKERIGEDISDSIIYKKSFSISDFKKEYNSYKGNAYGLANTLMQTATFKPSCRSKKVKNLFYTGQFTVPGPGVPPSLISGEVVSKELLKSYT